MCNNGSSNCGFLKKILGAICCFLNKVFSCGSSADTSGYSGTDIVGDNPCSPNQQGSFQIDNGNIYMNTVANATAGSLSLVSDHLGDPDNPNFPPSNFQIQQVFPGYGFLTSSDATRSVDAIFHKHNSWFSSGDAAVFQVCISSSSPLVYTVFFMVLNGDYHMTKDPGSDDWKSVGGVIKNGNTVQPPTNDMIRAVFPEVWLASGSKEEYIRNALFGQLGGQSGAIFPVNVFDGPD